MIQKIKQKPTTDFTKLTMLLYGEPKIGKSTFCSRFEDAFFIATEPGLNHLETYNARVNCWDEAVEVLEELTYTKEIFSPIIVDTIDKLWDFCCEDAAMQCGQKTVDFVAYGKGYSLAKDMFKKYIQSLVNLNAGIIFTSHVSFVEMTIPTGETIKRFVPSVNDRCREIIYPLVDIIGYVDIETDLDPKTGERKTTRIFRAREGALWVAGDRTGILPEKFPFSQYVYKKFFEETEVKNNENQTVNTDSAQ